MRPHESGLDRERLGRVIADAKTKLYAARAKRTRPARDEKILASWNGLMLRGLATAARAFENAEITKLAERNGDFLFSQMVKDGRVARSWSKSGARINGFLEDYAAVALGFISLYELTFDTKWITRATDIANAMVEWFWDEQLGAFFDTAARCRSADHAAEGRDGQRDAFGDVDGRRAAAHALGAAATTPT